MKKNKEKQYRITLSESQLHMIADCLEDCHRFMGGQVELYNCTSMLDNMHQLHDKLKEVYPLVVPELYKQYGYCRASYGWSGGDCPNEFQRRFMAQSYYLYREIRHFFALKQESWNTYHSETLRCTDSGEPIKIEEV